MQAASAHPTSVMCWLIIAQTIASPDPGNVVLHFLRHPYISQAERKKETGPCFQKRRGPDALHLLALPSSDMAFAPRLAAGTGVSASREIRSGAFPQRWPFIRPDTR